MRLEPLSSAIGATITGINLNKLDAGGVSFIRQALTDHLVVFFRDQQLGPEELMAVARAFGNPVPYPFLTGMADYPEVVEVIKEPGDTLNFGGVWHSDTAYLEQPAQGALLYGVEIPAVGGDTVFTNMYAVFDDLSDGMKTFLSPLRAINEADKASISATRPGQPSKKLQAEHPVVRTHPDTGKKLLYVDEAHTTRFSHMSEADSAPILEMLFERIRRPEYACRFRWTPGALAFWDNRACQHYPLNDYHGHRRRMLRISLEGETPVP